MAIASLPRSVVALGFVSLLMDLSSEMIHSLLPLFLVTILGASPVAIGIIEGIAEATAAMVKIFSGTLSDRFQRRKPLILLGYGLAAVSKPLFPLANSVETVLTARFLDRIGKGIRGAPRDALIADVTPETQRGAAYGLRQAMDTIGAFLGPLAATLLMATTGNNFPLVFWVATLPAFLAIVFILFAVTEPPRTTQTHPSRTPITLAAARELPLRFWSILALAAILALARFSEAFLLLRAENLGLAATWTPLVLIAMNLVYAVSAYPFGKGFDSGQRRALLLWGIGFLIVADLLLALADHFWFVYVGAMFWGLHMGATQGLLSAWVAEHAPHHLRGTAFGLFNLISGVALLGASTLAGGLWAVVGPKATFLSGATFATIAAIGLIASGAWQNR